jgi:Glycosyl hydrolase family 12
VSGPALAAAVAMTALAAASANAAGASAASTPLSGMQSRSVASGAYTVQNDEWGSGQPESISTAGRADFAVAGSSIANPANGAPGAYPSIYAGCHWGDCTRGGLAAHPVPVARLTDPGTVTTSWTTVQPGGSAAYDVAYDVWFNQAPVTTGQPDGAELMIWLNHHGPVQPFGTRVGTATINGVRYQVWEGAQSWGDTVSYVMARPATSVRGLDVGALAADAVGRGYIRASWYLIDVEAGFELWRGGAGLATDSFSVRLRPSLGSAALAPARVRALAAPGPRTTISRQAISPGSPAPRTATDVTVDFTNSGSAVAADVTLVIEVVNSAGTVVGSQSWPGQNVAPQQKLNETCAWTAAPQAGRYTIKGLVRNSAGKILQQARVAAITVP